MHFLPPSEPLPWVTTIPGIPYFQTDDGQAWHPVGQNDSISWHELDPLFRRKDVAAVDAHLHMLANHGVTCMRLMLEYAQVRHRYFEKPSGMWSPNLVRLWDDLFAMCERHGIRVLLTPFDTFWMWLHFKHHPYNRAHGGPLDSRSRMLLSKSTRVAIKARLTFAAERWGGSGALFAWDLWNEIHPAHAEMDAKPFTEFIEDLSAHVRGVEARKFGRSHPQTVSLFGPELTIRPEMGMEEAIFRHPSLDFATIHIYEHGTVDDPKNTVDAAVGMGRIVQRAVAEINDRRPFLDTEHGPIHSFKDKHKTLPAAFDDEYFRHMQWAHLASGGAGGGMRWPNRTPHSLTAGMRVAQRGLANFLPCVDWKRFDRRNVSGSLEVGNARGGAVAESEVARFGCASRDQAVVYLLRKDTLKMGQLDRAAAALGLTLRLPMLEAGRYTVTVWDTVEGRCTGTSIQELGGEAEMALELAGDVAMAFQRML